MWRRSGFFKYAAAVIMILVIIFLLGRMGWFFSPFIKAAAAIFVPVLVAGFFYYLLRPAVRFLEKKKIPKILTIAGIFLFCAGILGVFLFYAGSLLVKQAGKLARDLPDFADLLKYRGKALIRQNNTAGFLFGKIQQQAAAGSQKVIPFLATGILNLAEMLPRLSVILIIMPFFLFYFLKDGGIFLKRFMNFIPERYRQETSIMLKKIDRILASYITGQSILAVGAGVLVYAGYWIIDMPFAFIFAVFAALASFVPSFGLLMGMIPAFLVGLAGGPWMALKVLILYAAVQTGRKLAAPGLISKQLRIHPLAIILILLIAGSLYGFPGILVGAPVYAVALQIYRSAVNIYRERNAEPDAIEKNGACIVRPKKLSKRGNENTPSARGIEDRMETE
ncbi:MAG: AI-2E family transporter [Bacillota bacterium]